MRIFRLLGSLLKTRLPLLENLLKPLAKSLLIPLGLTAAASKADTVIHQKMFGPGFTAVTSDEEMNDILNIIKSLKESVVLIKDVRERIKS